MVRLQPDQLAKVDGWRERQDDTPTRPEAIRSMIESATSHVFVDGRRGAYGVTFPDKPGCTAMGSTLAEALENAAGALRNWERAR